MGGTYQMFVIFTFFGTLQQIRLNMLHITRYHQIPLVLLHREPEQYQSSQITYVTPTYAINAIHSLSMLLTTAQMDK
jgi:hypothetical protein